MRTTTTGFARDHFGEHAAHVVRAVVESMVETQAAGCRAQRAAGMPRLDTYGSVWSLRYSLLVDTLRDLPGAEVVRGRPANYPLVRVSGRLLLPFKLASSLADIPVRPQLDSSVLRAHTARTVPPPVPPPSLFDDLDDQDAEERASDGPDEAVELAPVLIGVVANFESDPLLGLFWGVAASISRDGVVEWKPEQLPVQLAPHARGDLRTVTALPTGYATASFTDGEVPDDGVRPRRTTRAQPGEHPAVGEVSPPAADESSAAAGAVGDQSPADLPQPRPHDNGRDE